MATGCTRKQANALSNELESLAGELENLGNELETTTPELEVAEGSLQDFYSKDGRINQLKEQLEAMRQLSYADIYKKIDFEVSGNMVEYTYTYVDGMTADAEALKAAFTEEVVEEQKDNFEQEAGVRPTKLAFTYEESDGTRIIKIEY